MPFRHAIILQTIAKPGQLPSGLCPLYVPGAADYLGVYPMASEVLRLPGEVESLSCAVELALFCELEYGAAGEVDAVAPRMAGAFLGGAIGEAGMKWSVRRQWGAGSCAVGALEVVDCFSPGAVVDGWNWNVEVVRAGVPVFKGEIAPAKAYPLFYEKFLEWAKFTLNHQSDHGAFERVGGRLVQAELPMHALITLGALPGEMVLRRGDEVKIGEMRVAVG